MDTDKECASEDDSESSIFVSCGKDKGKDGVAMAVDVNGDVLEREKGEEDTGENGDDASEENEKEDANVEMETGISDDEEVINDDGDNGTAQSDMSEEKVSGRQLIIGATCEEKKEDSTQNREVIDLYDSEEEVLDDGERVIIPVSRDPDKLPEDVIPYGKYVIYNVDILHFSILGAVMQHMGVCLKG